VSVKVIAELNPFSTKRTVIEVNPCTIKEIITEINKGFPVEQARVSRNGEIVTDFLTEAKDGDTLWIKYVPYGTPQQTGVGMKIGGWALTIAGIALVAALGWTGIGGMAGFALIGSGISLALGGTVLMNISIPKLKDREKPEHDPSIRGGRNQPRPHGRIPVLFGRHLIFPDTAANPYTQIIDGKQYYTQLFCGGYKDYVIDFNSFRLGDTPLIDLSQTKKIESILAGNDPVIRLEIMQNGERSGIYPSCVHEDALNSPLVNKTDENLSGEFIRTTPDKTDAINVDIFFFNGIGKYNKNGDLVKTTVHVQAEYKKENEPDSAYKLLGYFNNGSANTITAAELKTKRFQITKSGLTPGRYTVRLTRVTEDSKDSNIIDQVHAGSIRSIKSVRPIRHERQKDLTVIAMRVMATGRLNGVVDRLNYVAVSKVPVYAGNGTGENYWLSSAQTRNPAAMLLYALKGRASQQPVDSEDIDWSSLEVFYSWCEEHNYTCNAYLSEAVTISEIMKMIGSTARADVLRIDSRIGVVQDIERDSPVQLFTPKNTTAYSVTMFNADVPDSISIRYVDEDAGYAQNELSIFNTSDGNKIKESDSVQKLDLWGVTNSVQARRLGMYNYACIKNRPFVHTIEVDIEYLLCNKGDWIQYAGDIALTGSVQGRIIEPLLSEGRCIGIRIDEPVDMEPGKQYSVRLRKQNGAILLKEIVLVNKPNDVYFAEPFETGNTPNAGDVYAFGIRGQEVLDLVITDIQPGQNLCAVLTCAEYSPAIFGVDNPDFVLPEFENKITPVSGAVDSGEVNPNRWRVFTTYHDDDKEPPGPEGGGQNSGWHYAQTLRSVWQSSKTSETVDQGEWGPPVRIRNTRDNTDVVPVYLKLTPQSRILDCDGDGNVLAGLLPFTAEARLFRWNAAIPVQSGIIRYPGTSGNLFDPMPDGFYPAAADITYSLLDAPQGVSINDNGLITIDANTKLADENSIIVQAQYKDEIYSAVLFISKDTRRTPARYLGTINTLPVTPDVVILKGPVQGQVRARQGDYVLAVANGYNWKAGGVYQWTGTAWEYREPLNNTDLYMRCFNDGLDVPELTQEMGWFGALFAQLLVTQKAFIEELQAQLIQVKGAIFGGERFTINTQGELVDNDPSGSNKLTGFKLGSNGKFFAADGDFRGHIIANSGVFDNVTIGSGAVSRGRISVGNLIVDYDPNSMRRFPASGTYPTGTSVDSIRSAVAGWLGISLTAAFTINVDDGMYNNERIYQIEFRLFIGMSFVNRIKTKENTYVIVSSTEYPLWFQLGTGDLKMRFVNLPLNVGAASAAGTAWRQDAGGGNSYVMVKN